MEFQLFSGFEVGGKDQGVKEREMGPNQTINTTLTRDQ